MASGTATAASATWRTCRLRATATARRASSAKDVGDVRFALVSDVHGNLTALRAVVADLRRRGVERVLHGGDLALMGPRPAEVVDLVAELGWEGVVGNTDEVLWRPDEHEGQLARAPKLAALLDLIFGVYAPVTGAALGEERLAWLRELPAERRVGDWAIVHAAPGDLWSAPAPDAGDAVLAGIFAPLGAHAICR